MRIARLGSLDTYVDQTIDLMRDGMRRGLVQPRVIMERVSAQIGRQLVADAAKSPFCAPFDVLEAHVLAWQARKAAAP